jgi:iron complex transport system ATP-binding protein
MSAALQFENATLRYGARAALDDVTASIAPGQVTGIVGPNGAGKTTLLKIAAGLLPLASGKCFLFGRAIETWPREARARKVAYLPQGGEAAWPVAAREIVGLGRLPHRAPLSFLLAADALAVERALQRAAAAEFANRRIDALSAGERARVLLARALATEADVLLADEPTAHLDPAHQLRLMALLREEAKRGAAIAVTMHELSLAARACDRILLLDKGRLAAEGTPDEALSAEALARVFGVEAVRVTGPDGLSASIPWRTL